MVPPVTLVEAAKRHSSAIKHQLPMLPHYLQSLLGSIAYMLFVLRKATLKGSETRIM